MIFFEKKIKIRCCKSCCLILVIKGAKWDFVVHRLEVHVITVYFKRSLWGSKLSLVTKVRFTMNKIILDCKSPSYSETVTLILIG